jgi:hypothetical protein
LFHTNANRNTDCHTNAYWHRHSSSNSGWLRFTLHYQLELYWQLDLFIWQVSQCSVHG